jgi:ABC-2 type transport system ATP-binding protein
MPATVAVRNLSKAYGGTEAVSAVSFDIAAGEVLGLLGPNGAGKTTTVESVIGLVEPDTGSVDICGIDARRRPSAARQKIGVSLQETGLQAKITPREALGLFGGFYRTPSDPVALLERFGLTAKADAAFDSLSGGQKQRLVLALAFVNDPAALFLDEPAAGLDPQMRRELHDHIRAMRGEGCAILLTTHDMEEAELLCDRIAVIDHGRIVAEGTPRALIAGAQSAVSVAVHTSAPPAGGPGPIRGMLWDGASGKFSTPDLNRALADLIPWLEAQKIQLIGVRAARATLEDVILGLTGGGDRP